MQNSSSVYTSSEIIRQQIGGPENTCFGVCNTIVAVLCFGTVGLDAATTATISAPMVSRLSCDLVTMLVPFSVRVFTALFSTPLRRPRG